MTGARRVTGRNDLWRITVEPDGRDDVTITLPGNRDCGTRCRRAGRLARDGAGAGGFGTAPVRAGRPFEGKKMAYHPERRRRLLAAYAPSAGGSRSARARGRDARRASTSLASTHVAGKPSGACSRRSPNRQPRTSGKARACTRVNLYPIPETSTCTATRTRRRERASPYTTSPPACSRRNGERVPGAVRGNTAGP